MQVCHSFSRQNLTIPAWFLFKRFKACKVWPQWWRIEHKRWVSLCWRRVWIGSPSLKSLIIACIHRCVPSCNWWTAIWSFLARAWLALLYIKFCCVARTIRRWTRAMWTHRLWTTLSTNLQSKMPQLWENQRRSRRRRGCPPKSLTSSLSCLGHYSMSRKVQLLYSSLRNHLQVRRRVMCQRRR